MAEFYSDRGGTAHRYIYPVDATRLQYTPDVLFRRPLMADVVLTPTLVVPNELPASASKAWAVDVPSGDPGTFELIWTFPLGSQDSTETVSFIDGHHMVRPYATPEEFAGRYGLNLGDPAVYEETVVAERYARYIVDKYCGQTFGRETKVVTAYGTGADVLWIGENVTSVLALAENNVPVIDTEIMLNTFGYDVVPTETGMSIRIVADHNIDEYETKSVVWTRGIFRTGWKYDITGLFGYEYVPVDITEATMLLMHDFLCRDAKWRAKYVKAIQMRDWKLDFSTAAFLGTGNLMVDQLLSEYRAPGMFVI